MKYLIAALLGIVIATILYQHHEPEYGDNVLILGTNPYYPPYESTVSNNIIGFDIDVANMIASKLDKKLVIKEFDFDSLIIALQQNKVDFIMGGISITPSRQKVIDLIPYQGETIKSLALVFWSADPVEQKTLDDLAGETVAVQVGSFQAQYLNAFSSKLTVRELESNSDLLMDIQYKKSAAALLEPLIAEHLKNQEPMLKVASIALPEEQWVLGNGIGFSKNNTALKQAVEKILQQSKHDGSLAELERKWFE